jgi:phosphate/sulfate permease
MLISVLNITTKRKKTNKQTNKQTTKAKKTKTKSKNKKQQPLKFKYLLMISCASVLNVV